MSTATNEGRFDWYQAFAEARRNVPPGWRWYKLQVIDHQAPRDQQTVLAAGGVAPAITRGKYAGRPNWRTRDKSLDRTVAFRFAEIEQFQREWAAETGKCAECQGTGSEYAGWSSANGTKYVDCRTCGATGLARRITSTPAASAMTVEHEGSAA